MEQAGLFLLAQPTALAADVEHLAVVQQPIEDRGSDYRVAKHIVPLGKALVGGQDPTAALVAGRNQREERGGGGPGRALLREETS